VELSRLYFLLSSQSPLIKLIRVLSKKTGCSNEYCNLFLTGISTNTFLFEDLYLCVILNSVLRLFAIPSSVSLVSIGLDSPNPLDVNLSVFIPFDRR
jgi:hypothetical protein